MNSLYPLKFRPIVKSRIWGGKNLNKLFGKPILKDSSPVGESWEISSVEGNISVVSNGFLAGNNLQELIEVYMGDLIGDKVYEKFGDEFPLLIKLIDATDDLSIQVHPNDSLANELHNAWGKSEFWYILQAEAGARLVTGFNKTLTPEEYQIALRSEKLEEYLRYQQVSEHDSIYIPAGLVHAIGKGIMLLEVQQASDVTYRIYDWNRKDSNGKKRDLHTDLALKAIDFTSNQNVKKHEQFFNNSPENICTNPYFSVNRLMLTESTEKTNFETNSFTIYVCVDGELSIQTKGNQDVDVKKGESVLVPAEINNYTIATKTQTILLEILIT